MTLSPTISPVPPEGPGLNYVTLLEDALALLQDLSGAIWTDYNEHDPGVTIVEQLCYALTELAYRADYPVADILAAPRAGGGPAPIDLRGQSLYPARAIFPSAPVTADDFRRVILDWLPELGNVWLTPVPARDGVNGLYDIAVLAPKLDPCGCNGPTAEQVRHGVLRVYRRFRALCEDVRHVHVLDPRAATVRASVLLDGGRESALILADMLFAVGMLLAPEPRRKSLSQMLDAGLTPAGIFDGPLMRNGFIQADQLGPKASSIPVADILRAMASVEGVVSVSDLSVRVAGEETPYGPGDSIPVNGRTILVLTNGGQGGGPGGGHGSGQGPDPIHLWRNGVPCHPPQDRVRRQLARLWAAQRRTYRLAAEYRRYFPTPQGQWFDPASYYSVQNQFPNLYGISEYGLPANATPVRQGQAKQLKGYLLPFEQVLADYFSQLAHVRDLYSAREGHGPTYFSQSLAGRVPGVEPLLSDDYEKGLHRVVAASDPAPERRNRFLNYLLALYAEQLTLPPSPDCDCQQGGDSGAQALIHAKRALLHRLVAATANRGRGFDYGRPSSPVNRPGMEIKTRIELGLLESMDDRGDSGLDMVTVVEDPLDASFGRFLSAEASTQTIDGFIRVDPSLLPAVDPGADSPFVGHTVAADLLPVLQSIDSFRLGVLPRDRQVSLICRAPGSDRCWHLGKFATLESCFAEVARILAHAADLLVLSRRLYVVEHLLLRAARRPGEITPFPYAFTLSVVLSACILGDDQPDAMRRQVEATVRENSPAHVALRFCYLNHRQMRRFLALRHDWLNALRDNGDGRLAWACARLRDFLIAHDGEQA